MEKKDFILTQGDEKIIELRAEEKYLQKQLNNAVKSSNFKEAKILNNKIAAVKQQLRDLGCMVSMW